MALDVDDMMQKFGRFGRILYLSASAQNTMAAGYDSLATEFGTEYDEIVGPVQEAEAAAVRGFSGAGGVIAQAAQRLLLAEVKADVAPAAGSVPEALAELRRQMIAGSDSVNACAVTINTTVFSTPTQTGDGVIVTATKRGDGLTQEHIVAEDARVICLADSYSDQATEGREPFIFVGSPQEAGVFDYDWPTGSGTRTGLTAIDASQDASTAGNLLTNGDMEDWSADATPEVDNWVTADTWGTHLQRSSTPYAGTYALEFIAAANNTTVYQQFGQTDGTGTTADPVTQTNYAVSLWVRKVSGTISAGVLTVELHDGSAVIDDEQGTANSFTIDLTAVTTTYANYTGVFRLPAVKPSTIRLRLRTSTQLAGGNVLVDHVAVGRMTQAYPGGPNVAVFSGATPFLTGDGWDVVTTNDRGGNSFGATFQTLFLRLFGRTDFLLPSDAGGSETQADTLITGA